ncbi:hypothetical protein RGR602_CH00635 [Rhizobium gallicum bv. gallicum R602sp]|uniref:Uncharacterized protein n=1 Tax=Rhizobium gallicum bv. gallicum R602sp TaxID=1041138 RepID=A0A0B4X0C8_9HYPH|nr:hypothetical protein RGR602_CH00635 [Rhizobium gallicum bv. gallicum R602sp]
MDTPPDQSLGTLDQGWRSPALVDSATVAGADMLIYSGCKGRRATGGALEPRPQRPAHSMKVRSADHASLLTGAGAAARNLY